ncbi:MAG: DinB family protein [Chloroflexota bacterium]
MAEFTRELFLQALDEWGRYAGAYGNLPAAEQADFLKAQGHASMRDLLAHVAVWWEEARGIIAETIKRGDGPARKYDFGEFNAAALQRFRDTPEAELMAWYESERQQMVALVTSLTDEQMRVRRICSWLDGVVLERLKEHAIHAPRFLMVDMLQREWGDYVARFNALNAEKQAEFLKQQGFERFRDVMAHNIAWWEQGIAVVEASSSGNQVEAEDIDAFNAEAVARFGQLEETQVLQQFDDTRLTLASLMDMLPDEVLGKPTVQSWLRADVLDHYYEHAI